MFDMSVGGRDEAGGINNSMTNYYIRKYLYAGWNGNDDAIQTMPKSIFFHPLGAHVPGLAEAPTAFRGRPPNWLWIHRETGAGLLVQPCDE